MSSASRSLKQFPNSGSAHFSYESSWLEL